MAKAVKGLVNTSSCSSQFCQRNCIRTMVIGSVVAAILGTLFASLAFAKIGPFRAMPFAAKVAVATIGGVAGITAMAFALMLLGQRTEKVINDPYAQRLAEERARANALKDIMLNPAEVSRRNMGDAGKLHDEFADAFNLIPGYPTPQVAYSLPSAIRLIEFVPTDLGPNHVIALQPQFNPPLYYVFYIKERRIHSLIFDDGEKFKNNAISQLKSEGVLNPLFLVEEGIYRIMGLRNAFDRKHATYPYSSAK